MTMERNDMTTRMSEMLELARAGDEDVALQLTSEIALLPETEDQRLARLDIQAEEHFEQFAPVVDGVDDALLDQLADEAGF